jgi:hypothetical protein
MVRSRCLAKPSNGQDRRKRITVSCRDADPGSRLVKVVHLPSAGSALQGDRTVSGTTLNPSDERITGTGKQIGVSKATQSTRNLGNR